MKGVAPGLGGVVLCALLLLAFVALVRSGARVHGARQDRTVASGVPAQLAAAIVARPPARRMERHTRQVGDVRPLEFVGPFPDARAAQQLFEGMRRQRGVSKAVVCTLNWAATDEACDQGDLSGLPEALEVRLCRLGAASPGLPRCGQGQGDRLVLLLSEGALVVQRQRRADCARRACQIRGW